MKKIFPVLLWFSFYSTAIHSQDEMGKINFAKLPPLKPHYDEEYSFDSTIDAASWMKLSPGMQVSFASTDKHYFRTVIPDLKVASDWQGTGWKGERLNAMVLIWSPDTISQIRFVLRDLKNKNGSLISKRNLQLNMVRYVVSNYPYNALNATCDVSPFKDGYLMPDRFEEFEQFDLSGRSVRPIWLSINIPQDASAGIYKGMIDVLSQKGKVALSITVRVQNHRLPAPHDWKYRLDLWQNPWVIARYNHLTPWSAEHKLLLKKHLSLYAGAGGKYITTYAVHSPWADNSYQIEESMIEWIKTGTGSWAFDYTIFDEYVKLAMEAGIDKAITIYTPIPWGNRFRYLDKNTGNYIYEVWAPGSAAYTKAWNAFLTELQVHLQKKGWLEKTYLGINENEMEQVLAAIRVIRAHSKKWKITYAGNWHKELDSLLNDYCFLYGNEATTDIVKHRRERGYTTTYYICCNPPKPNDFLFSPPIEGRWLSWYAAAHNYDGFLRWAYDAWPADPNRDARHILWPAGDCFLVYPGGASCVRFEKLREGIVDFEKLSILEGLAAKTNDQKIKTLIKSLDDQMQIFLNEHEFDTQKITNDVDKGRKIVEELSDIISY